MTSLDLTLLELTMFVRSDIFFRSDISEKSLDLTDGRVSSATINRRDNQSNKGR